MASVTNVFSLVAVVIIASSSNAQYGSNSAIPPHLMQWINSMANGVSSTSSSSLPSTNTNSNTNTLSQQPPQLSLVESFGPISSQAITTGTQTDLNPFNTQTQTQTQTQTLPQTHTLSIQQILNSLQTQPTGTQTQTQGPSSGPSMPQYFDNSAAGPFGGVGTNPSSNFINSGSSLPAASEPVGNDILAKVAAFVNQGLSATGGAGPAPPAGPPPGNWLTPQAPGGPGMLGGPGPAPAMPPMTPVGGLMPGMIPVDPLRNQAMLKVSRRISQRFGVKQYYQIHGCEDPTLLFTGPQKAMAVMAMAQGCHSFQASRICQQAQIKERIGNSLLTSRILPPQVTSRLESCLSAKVLIAPISSGMSGMSPSMAAMTSMATGVPSMQECGMLLTTVMDGGSLDPESMIHSRRSMLPWSCNELNMGANGIAYRVCCPGKVHEPTLQEATLLQRMLNA